MLETQSSLMTFGRTLTAFTFSLVTTAYAEPDYRSIAFHPVPLTADNTLESPASAPQFVGDMVEIPSLTPEQSLQASVDQYRESITELENAGGPFNIMLAQQSEALGDLLQQSGDHEGAVEAFDKSLHILRVNEGLYSPGQEQILRKSIHSQLAMDNVDEAGDLHEALLYLQRRIHDKGDVGYVDAILEWADWNVDRHLAGYGAEFRSPPGVLPGMNLVSAQEHYIEAIESIRMSTDTSPALQQRLVHAEKKLAAINYIANSATMPKSPPSSISMFADPNPFSAENRRAENAGMAYFFNGSNALKRAIAYSLESPQPDYLFIAEQMMALGDWYLLFDRRVAALAVYEDTFEVLDAIHATAEDIQRIMTPGMPVSIPATPGSRRPDAEFEGYIDVEFQVSKFGIASRPEVIASSARDDSPAADALIRKIRQEKFRPAFIDGSATGSENVKLRYYYSYNQ